MTLLSEVTHISDALGWAVLHSFWQGGVALIFVWGSRRLIKQSVPEARYLLGFTTLATLLITFIGTFLYNYKAAQGAGLITAHIQNMQNPMTPVSNIQNSNIISVSATNPLRQLGEYTGLIGGIWTLCFAIMSLRSMAAFRLSHKLRRAGVSDLPDKWNLRFRRLARRAGLKEGVNGFISEHVSSPITLGAVKPIVLMPVWFFSGLTSDQCEAVLLHEFAHIRRHDYVANIVQIIIKTVFFYHPAVLAICKMLDADREHACDDFAVKLSNNPEGLAVALGTIRLRAASDTGVFALSADGPEAPFLHRLKRLVGRPAAKNLHNSGRDLAALLLLAGVVAMSLALGTTNAIAQSHTKGSLTKETHKKETQGLQLAGGETTPPTPVPPYVPRGPHTTPKAREHAFEDAEARQDALEAQQEALEDAEEARQDALEAQQEALEDAEEARQEARAYRYNYDYNYSSDYNSDYKFSTKEHQRRAKEIAKEIAREAEKIKNKMARKQQEIAKLETLRADKIEAILQDIDNKRAQLKRKIRTNRQLAPGEMGRLQGEIGRLQGSIGRLQGLRGADQGELGRLQGELGRLQGQLGALQGKLGNIQSAQFENMRKDLTRMLLRDGYIKSKKQKIKIALKASGIIINGRKLRPAQEKKYSNVFRKYGIDRTDQARLAFGPNGYSLSIDSHDGHTSRSYSQNHSHTHK